MFTILSTAVVVGYRRRSGYRSECTVEAVGGDDMPIPHERRHWWILAWARTCICRFIKMAKAGWIGPYSKNVFVNAPNRRPHHWRVPFLNAIHWHFLLYNST